MQAWLWIMCAAIVVALVAGVGVVLLADRNPFYRHRGQEPRRGRVQGGTHVGGGRSVAPRRDAPVTLGEDPEDSTVTPPRGSSEDSALPGRAGRSGSGSGNPLDLGQ
jgi:hypothetical protein